MRMFTPEEVAAFIDYLIMTFKPRSEAVSEATKDVEFTVKDCKVARQDIAQIVVPENMKLKEAIKWLQRRDADDDKEIAVQYEIDCFPLDGAVALRDVLDDIYGFVQGVDIPGGWFSPDKPPVMIGVPVSATEVRQVPWGRVEIPGIAGFLQTSMVAEPQPRFIIAGVVKQRHKLEVQRIAEATTRRVKTHSIYKGKAIRLDLSWKRNGQDFHPTQMAPTFSIPVDKIEEKDLIFPANVQSDVDVGLFTPIVCANKCRQHKIPLHRGVLLAGDYGTGKTLTAYVTARKAVEHGFTFIYLASVLDLAEGHRFAAQYAPAVIFAEDVDQVVKGERTDEMNEILNSLDGVDTKHGEVITVLTTNYLEKLDQAILRPGRCDTLVQVTRPDADAASRLVQLYGRGLISPKADLAKIGRALDNHLPAEIREAVERAKLAAIYRLVGSGAMVDSDEQTIEGHVMDTDILAAVHAMEAQHALLAPKETDSRSTVERAFDILGKGIGLSVEQVLVATIQRLGVDGDALAVAASEIDVEGDLVEVN